MFDGKRIFVSGATGSWGQTLVSQLLVKYDVREIVCFSRNEYQQVTMKRKFDNPKLWFVIGDICDRESVIRHTQGIDYIFHLAAMKHVPICEEFPEEAIKTNIRGTQSIIDAAIFNKVKKVIDVSSDKAVEPINVYGMTKAVGEKLIIHANTLSDHTKFVCIRGGNVMGSSGSVIPLFIEQLLASKPIKITDKRMTRFFLTLEEAIDLIFKASENSLGGEIFVMNMPSCYITDLAEVLIERYGKCPIEYTGIRPGEKLDEILVSANESRLTYVYDKNYYVILPPSASGSLLDKYQSLAKFSENDFTSKTYLLSKTEIHDMLAKGKFI